MPITKLNLQLGERVRIIGSPEKDFLNGRTGKNLGKCEQETHGGNYYIILLDEPIDTHLAINILEKYLEKLPDDDDFLAFIQETYQEDGWFH
jgi:hypothetical protein